LIFLFDDIAILTTKPDSKKLQRPSILFPPAFWYFELPDNNPAFIYSGFYGIVEGINANGVAGKSDFEFIVTK
jgi:hypothetical protein